MGTIYRAVTGDEVAEPVRRVGSAIGSFLMGGPIGLALNVAGVGAEKVLGFDFDKAAQGLLTTVASAFGGGTSDAPAPAPTAASAFGDSASETPAPALTPAPAFSGGASDAPAATRLAWTPAQLSAYGVSTQADGTLTRGDLSGADVLNTLEMARIGSLMTGGGIAGGADPATRVPTAAETRALNVSA